VLTFVRAIFSSPPALVYSFPFTPDSKTLTAITFNQFVANDLSRKLKKKISFIIE